MVININCGTKMLEIPDGGNLIGVLATHGIHVPSACGNKGACGLCKVKVIAENHIFSKQELIRLTDDERLQGIHLGCQVSLKDSIEIELPQEYLSAQEYTARVYSKKLLTRDIVELRLQLLSPTSISFHPGQYILMKTPQIEGRRGVMRPFSIASSNAGRSIIDFNIRLNPEGICTRWIFDELQDGQEVRFAGPRGVFYIKNTERPMLFVAGGSGMAPVRSILQTMRDHRIERKAVFVFGALTQSDLFYGDEMRLLQTELRDFQFIPALSSEPLQSDWAGKRGLVTEVIAKLPLKDYSEYEAYLCGKPAMIEGCVPILNNMGIPNERIYFDLFNVARK